MADNLINEAIRVPQVRLVDENGEQLGVMPTRSAQDLADERSLDLVLIAPQGQPPVCRLMDYGKFRFENQKREKENRKKQKVLTVKEVQLSYTIDERDIEIKARNAIRFLQDGDRVRVSFRFRGRQITHPEHGRAILQKFAELCSEVSKIDQAPRLEGRNMMMFLSPLVAKPVKAAKPEGDPGAPPSQNPKEE